MDTIGPCPPRENTDKESVPNPYYYENGQNYDDAPPDPTSDPSSGPPSISPIPQPFPNNELKQGLLDTQEPFALSLQDTPPPYLVEEGESLNPGLDPSLMNSSEDIFASNEDPLLFNGIEAFDASLDPSSISNVLGDESSPFTLAEAEPLNADISLDTNVFNWGWEIDGRERPWCLVRLVDGCTIYTYMVIYSCLVFFIVSQSSGQYKYQGKIEGIDWIGRRSWLNLWSMKQEGWSCFAIEGIVKEPFVWKKKPWTYFHYDNFLILITDFWYNVMKMCIKNETSSYHIISIPRDVHRQRAAYSMYIRRASNLTVQYVQYTFQNGPGAIVSWFPYPAEQSSHWPNLSMIFSFRCLRRRGTGDRG